MSGLLDGPGGAINKGSLINEGGKAIKMVNFSSVVGVIHSWYYSNGKTVWRRDDSGRVRARFVKRHFLGRPVIQPNRCNMVFCVSRAVDHIEKILNAHYFNRLGVIDFKAGDPVLYDDWKK